jgi:hypothetical protein
MIDLLPNSLSLGEKEHFLQGLKGVLAKNPAKALPLLLPAEEKA